jgi:hypothetical protein
MHIGRGSDRGKTEALYFPQFLKAARGDDLQSYASPSLTADIPVSDGFVHFTPSFRYLGSTITTDFSDAEDILGRIAAATAAFGALKSNIFCNNDMRLHAKRSVYHSYVLSILLYGCKTWEITKPLLNKLKSFLRTCVRQIFGCTLRCGRVTYAKAINGQRIGQRVHHVVLMRCFCMPDSIWQRTNSTGTPASIY